MAATGRAGRKRGTSAVTGAKDTPPRRAGASRQAQLPQPVSAGDRLSFERLVADLAAEFVNADPARLDDMIVDALRRIVTLLDVDRAQLIDLSGPDGGSRITHAWAQEGVLRAPPIVLTHLFPWATANVRAGRPVVIPRVSAMPAEAAIDRGSFTEVGVRSHLSMPMRVGGAVVGALAFGCLRAERDWPGDLLARIGVIADVFANALAHGRALRSLDGAVAFERTVSGVLARLLTAGAADREASIEAGLRDLARVFGADRATLWQRATPASPFVKTHRWLSQGTPPAPLPTSATMPWTFARVEAGDTVVFAALDELPAEAAGDLPAIRAIGVGAALIVPLAIDGAVVGALSFTSTRVRHGWAQELAPRARLVGEMFSVMLAREEAERRESEARAQAAHAARVGAMGVFAASLVHELTQPLAAALANAETAAGLIDEAALDRGELRSTVADIVADGRRASDLIQRLRRFLRRGEVERAEVELRALVHDVLRFVSAESAERGVKVGVEIEPGVPAVVCDRVQIQQVLINVLVNAFDAVGDRPADERRVDVAVRSSSGVVTIEVADSGVGMDADALARAFQPFHTTKPGGMGLGLAISRTIAAAHGGELTARSAPGIGSVFRLALPLRGEAEPPATEADVAGLAPGGRVHLIDDDPSMRRAIGRQLEGAGYSVTPYDSAEAFVERAAAGIDGCVVSDVRMPGMSGLDLPARLAELGRPLPIVFVSGHGDVSAGVRAMREGAVGFLPKPFTRDALLAAVAEAFARARAGDAERRDLADLARRRATLTGREVEVFELVAQGLLNKVIADRLGSAEATVKIHRGRVMDKMGASSLADLVRMAERLGEASARRAPGPA